MIKIQSVLAFSAAIEKMVFDKKIPYMEAVCEYCKTNDIDLTTVPRLINQKIKDHIEDEAYALNMFGKKKRELPTVDDEDENEDR